MSENKASVEIATSIVSDQLPFRRWLYSWLLDPNIEGNYQKSIDSFIALLIVGNLFALLLEQVPGILEPNRHLFHWFDIVSVIIFTIEYSLRLYLAAEDREFNAGRFPRLRYMSSPFALIDLVAIAPFYLAAVVNVDLRVLRALRLLRILKLFRLVIPACKEFAALNRGRSFRQKIHALVWPGQQYGGKLQEYFDTFIVVWVLISVVAVVMESVESVHFLLNVEFVVLDMLAVAVFTTEYMMRIYSVVEEPGYKHAVLGRIRFAKSGMAIVDFLAVVPFFLEALLHHLFDLRFLRVFRLLRLLKLTRYTGATGTLLVVIKREWPVMGASCFIMLLLVVLTASLGYLFEHEAQPDKFENIPTSIYWAVITLASVGYGDISPVTPAGRAMTIVLALLGIGIFAIPAALLSSAFSDQLRIERDALQQEMLEMLGDGVISEEERRIIDAEAKRLHLSKEEVERLLERAKREYEVKHGGAPASVDGAGMGFSMADIVGQPQMAAQYYREMLARICQLRLAVQSKPGSELQADTLTPLERDVWHRISAEMGKR